MGSYILRGITTALLVTVLTLFAGIVWGIMDLGGLSISLLLDIGLLASCIVGGYWTARESGEWLLGGIVGAGYVSVGTLLLALFLPVRGWGFIQVLAEGVIIGLVAGAIGAGGSKNSIGSKGIAMSSWSANRSRMTPSYGDYETNGDVNSKFDWDKGEDLDEWKEAPLTNWIESSNNDLKGAHLAKRDCGKEPEVQWSWDMEEEKVIDSGPAYSEPLAVWKPSPVRTEMIGGNRTILGKIGENKGSRPWWE